jgi:hypothetical protein
MPTLPVRLLPRATCPHCWASFAPEDVLWISAHADLLGDPRLGPDQQQRFLPSRFNIEGNAIDAKGFVCHNLACPHCHLPIPRAMLDTEALFVSILGTPACGKSYFLASLAWEARQKFSHHFGLTFADADPTANRSLNEYEEFLFLNPRPDELVPLASLIRKTELQGDLYDSVNYGNQAVQYPRPFLFALHPKDGHSADGAQRRRGRVLCLYDNAGEHFLAGQDSTSSPVTKHLAQSRLLLFLFDPTQDQRFRRLCAEKQIDSPTLRAGRTSRQETVLMEAAARVRLYTKLAQDKKHDRPLIVVLTKYDAWSGLEGDRPIEEPWVAQGDQQLFDLARVESRSKLLRQMLHTVCPEIVAAAENFVQSVTYVAVSALGKLPIEQTTEGMLAIRPRRIRPIRVTVPLLYGLCRTLPGLIAATRSSSNEQDKSAVRRADGVRSG